MDRLQTILKLLREIHTNHLTSVGGYKYDLLLANDHAMVALLDGYEEAVWRYANMARAAYVLLEIPNNVPLAADLARLVTTPTPILTAA